ncbi:MAG: lysoplasmalogenase [Salibacteraceae bacterium]|jgi:uncharacterized membrane protein YhhN|nr:lysoplasmalogenase [Salibacteraceae bacterium]MDP4685616.1 lysoplasmalogenase [Salibacteraceae bacterium]MDP4762402.1 lysoplasmalogenase [Salibacteraceae bacterium]MDP4844109.1 lysoplasmalogenase [Salibacteraceae bacterium]MDP4933364.1 lysoplasmalogenase [Salibacteraceae bacterium]
MKTFLRLFLAISAVYITLILFHLNEFGAFIKPLLLLSLILAVYKASTFKSKPILLIALLFSWLGDVLLIFVNRGELFFILGLVSFLISHLFYIALFLKQQSATPLNRAFFGIGIAATLAYLGTFLTIIVPHLGSLKLPVIIYAAVICIMLAVAIRGALVWKPNANIMILIGAISFIASDSLLAFNKFYNEFAMAGFFTISTYLLAQFCITRGILRLNEQDR